MSSSIALRPHWQRAAIVSIALPLLVGLAVLAFAYPAARVEPRELPVGIVGTTPASQQLVSHLEQAAPDGFDLRLYADGAAARRAILDRDIYGAFEIDGGGVRLLVASAASPAVARALEQSGQALAQASAPAGTDATPIQVTDVVPLSSDDPLGIVFSSCLLPLTICGMLVAAATGLLVRFRPAWRQILALLVVSVVAGAVAYLVGETYLGAFPDNGFAAWAVLSLIIFAISSSTAGLIALIGTAGLGLGAVLMVFIGNPFSGATSAPELLPGPVHHLGQLLPPGAGATALRDAAYFGGHGIGGELAVLIGWSVIGVATLIFGHHAPLQLAAQRLTPAEIEWEQRQAG